MGIIGVVAAMTIPTLVANTNSAKFRSQFKKTLSTLNQAGRMAKAQYGFDYATAIGTCGSAQDNPTESMTFCALLNGTLTGYSYIGASSNLKKADGSVYKWENNNGYSKTIGQPSDYVIYSLADGALIGFKSVINTDGATVYKSCSRVRYLSSRLYSFGWSPCLGFIDVNGVTGPNKEVTCEDETETGLIDGEVGADAEGNGGMITPSCRVPNDSQHLTDVFPIGYYDATVVPASNAAKYVLNSTK